MWHAISHFRRSWSMFQKRTKENQLIHSRSLGHKAKGTKEKQLMKKMTQQTKTNSINHNNGSCDSKHIFPTLLASSIFPTAISSHQLWNRTFYETTFFTWTRHKTEWKKIAAVNKLAFEGWCELRVERKKKNYVAMKIDILIQIDN